MRTKIGADKVVIQFGQMTVAADQSSAVAADPAVDTTVDVAVVMTPHENVSVSVHKQSSDIFSVVTSDTADGTADYLIVSTS
jgi:hypothetical protein